MASLPENCIGNTCLDIEEILSKYARHLEFRGDELKDVGQIGVFGSQVIHLASFANRCEDITAFVRAGVNIDSMGDLGLRPLHYAVLNRAGDAVRLLLEVGADAGAENEFGETPAQMARILGDAELEKMLLQIGGQTPSGYDGGPTAAQRWLEFRSMQQTNFWPDV